MVEQGLVNRATTVAVETTPPPADNRRALSPEALQVASEPVPQSYPPVVVAGIARSIEFSLIAAVGNAIYVASNLSDKNFGWHYPLAIFGVAAASVVAFQIAGIYRMQSFRSRAGQYAKLMAAWSFIFTILFAIISLTKAQDLFSRVWMLSFFSVGFLSLTAFRMVLFNMVRRWAREGRLARRTVIVGGGELAEVLMQQFKEKRGSDVRIIGLFDDRMDDRSPDTIAGQRKLGTVDDLVEFARRTRLDLVIFSLPITAETRILQMLQKLWVLPVDIRLAAHTNKLQFQRGTYSYLGNVPVIDVFDRPIADWDVVIKWVLDKIVGTFLLIAFAPLMALVAFAIKLDSHGPVLFKQQRYGFNNEVIEVFKFRSMYADQADATAAKVVTKDDPRVTRVGRFIRMSSLDELPQLFNVVFRGDLSLVGPRPHVVNGRAEQRLYEELVDGYFARHRVKPGVTGWAQISGWRGETDRTEKIQARVDHDLYYIENWSLLFDLRILARTPFALFRTENAY